jgi:KDO2-lipid IV(A) lauroyltransferase
MLVTLFRLLSRLPLPVLHTLGAALGWAVYMASPSYRRRLRENIARAGYRQHLGSAISAAGKSILELPFIWCADQDRVLATAEIDNWPLVQDAIDAGRGLVMLTPHLGCFELIAQVVAQHIPFTVLYRPPRKDSLKPLMEGARSRHNLILAPANLTGVRSLLKTLKRGGIIGLLPDQVPQNGEGVWADFFGKPAYTMTLSAKMKQMSGAPMLLCYAERKAGGAGYLVRFVPFEEELGETSAEQATAINRAMEKVIARCPEQYFWSYNRYKVPPGVEAATHEGSA